MFIIKTDLPRSEALQHIQMTMNAQNNGWTLTHKDDASITFTRTGKPSIAATIILLLFFIVPAILYLIFAWKKETANFFVSERKDVTAITVEAGLQTKQLGWKLYERLRKVTPVVETSANRTLHMLERYSTVIFAVVMLGVAGILYLYIV